MQGLSTPHKGFIQSLLLCCLALLLVSCASQYQSGEGDSHLSSLQGYQYSGHFSKWQAWDMCMRHYEYLNDIAGVLSCD